MLTKKMTVRCAQMFKDIVREAAGAEADGSVMGILRKTLNKTIGERDYIAVETCHLLQSLGLYQCSRAFETCRMDGQVEVEFGGGGGGAAGPRV